MAQAKFRVGITRDNIKPDGRRFNQRRRNIKLWYFSNCYCNSCNRISVCKLDRRRLCGINKLKLYLHSKRQQIPSC